MFEFIQGEHRLAFRAEGVSLGFTDDDIEESIKNLLSKGVSITDEARTVPSSVTIMYAEDHH